MFRGLVSLILLVWKVLSLQKLLKPRRQGSSLFLDT